MPDHQLVILSPVYNDWDAARLLTAQIDRSLGAAGIRGVRIVFVDDGSTSRPSPKSETVRRIAVDRIQVLPLRRNLGHQRAIAVGLAWVEQHLPCDAVVLMDSDGEDLPDDIPRLVSRFHEAGGRKLIFAERTKRLEKLSFRILYRAYRYLHFIATGISVRVGNFSIIPWAILRRLVVTSELWNHYAAAVFATKIPYEAIPSARGPRLAGRSRMKLVGLVVHGLSAMSVHAERMAVRVMMITFLGLALTGVALLAACLRPVLTASAIPTWSVAAVLAFFILAGQLLTLSGVLVVTVLHRRSGSLFLPARDYHPLVDPPFDLCDDG